MSDEQKELKKEILKALIDKEWSATDLANAMGISRVYMNDLINGRRISVARMEQIKKILGLSQKGDNLLKKLRKELKMYGGIRMDKETTIKEFLEFRSKFTKREWHELNQAIDERLKQKADQLTLDDSDLVVISDKLKRFIQKGAN